MVEVDKTCTIVRGSGPKSAKIAIVGEAPGLSEVSWVQCSFCGREFALEATIRGSVEHIRSCPSCASSTGIDPTPRAIPQPFVGTSGQKLDTWLAAGGLNRALVRIENLAELRPPGNDFKRIHEVIGAGDGSWADSLSYCRSSLLDRLGNLPNLRVVVCAGFQSLKALIDGPLPQKIDKKGKTKPVGITELRGSPFPSVLPGVTLVAMVHPAYMLRTAQWTYNMASTNDLAKAREIADGREPEKYISNILYTIAEILRELRTIPNNSVVAFDCETHGRRVDVWSFAYRKGDTIRSFAIPVFGYGYVGLRKGSDERRVQHALVQTLHRVRVVGQNFLYDARYFRESLGVNLPAMWWDTRWAAHALFPECETNLGYLNSLYTLIPYYKEERTGWGNIPLPDRWKYCAKDSAVTLLVQEGQEKDFKQRGEHLTNLFHNQIMPQFMPYHHFECLGLRVDKKLLQARGKELEVERVPLMEELLELRWGRKEIEKREYQSELVGGIIAKIDPIATLPRTKKARIDRVVAATETKLRNPDYWADLAKIKSLNTYYKRLLGKLQRTGAKGGFSLEFNPASPKQVAEWIYRKKKEGGLGFKEKKTRKGNPTTDDIALQSLLIKKPDCEPIRQILRVRSINTEISNFVHMKLSPDGRLRTQYQPLELTGRVASSTDAFNEGRNLQNLPRAGAAKNAIMADEGYVFEGFDMKQAEAIFYYWDAMWWEMCEVILTGSRDIHSESAEIGFGVKQEDFDAKVWKGLWRQAGKRVRHASNFGMGPYHMLEVLRTELPGFPITLSECSNALQRIRAIQPLIVYRQNEIWEQVRTTKMLSTPFGRTVQFHAPWSDHMGKQGLAYRTQSSIADNCDRTLFRLAHYWREERIDAHIVSQKHDEVLWMRPVESNHDYIADALRFHTPIVPVYAEEREKKGGCMVSLEFKRGYSFGSMEELKSLNDHLEKSGYWMDRWQEVRKAA